MMVSEIRASSYLCISGDDLLVDIGYVLLALLDRLRLGSRLPVLQDINREWPIVGIHLLLRIPAVAIVKAGSMVLFIPRMLIRLGFHRLFYGS